MRLLLGLGILAAGIAAFVAVLTVQAPGWEDGSFGRLLSAHDLRHASLIVAFCGLVLALSTIRLSDPSWPWFDRSWLPIGASLLAAGTLPLLVIGNNVDRPLDQFVPPPPSVPPGSPTGGSSVDRPLDGFLPPDIVVPPAYIVMLRAVQVLLVVAAIGAALAAGPVDRRRMTLGVGVGVVFAVLTMIGVHSALTQLVDGSFPVLGGVPAATALLLVWTGGGARLGVRQLGGVAVVLVGMSFLYGLAVVFGMLVSGLSLPPGWDRGFEHVGGDALPYIGAGWAAAAGLLLVHLLARPRPDCARLTDERRNLIA